jgi:hypothetical protein
VPPPRALRPGGDLDLAARLGGVDRAPQGLPEGGQACFVDRVRMGEWLKRSGAVMPLGALAAGMNMDPPDPRFMTREVRSPRTQLARQQQVQLVPSHLSS